ncbi:hypothetical protein HanRHA438_Chr11g0492351 [Helianthus annuus]|nr:hypothetical protein HanRHA438_Chr11g0492351 [Helianthus annuus]
MTNDIQKLNNPFQSVLLDNLNIGVNTTVSWISTAHLIASGHDLSVGCRHTPNRR